MSKEKKHYLEILFHFKGKLVHKKICVNHIDPTHYEGLWDWWFRSENGDFRIPYDFKLTGNKLDYREFSFENLYIHVYPIDADDFIKRIDQVYIRRSWVKEGVFTDSKKLKNNKTLKL